MYDEEVTTQQEQNHGGIIGMTGTCGRVTDDTLTKKGYEIKVQERDRDHEAATERNQIPRPQIVDEISKKFRNAQTRNVGLTTLQSLYLYFV